MKISVFGLGYVGTVCAACMADRGHSIIGVDKSETKVKLVQSGRSPIIERDIDDLVKRMTDAGRLRATISTAEAIASSDLSIICVGTPSRSNGGLSLNALENVCRDIGKAIGQKSTRHVVVVRSTILPGTTRGVVAKTLTEASARSVGDSLGIAFNPEFLREGSAVSDFNTPSKTVVGALDEPTAVEVMNLYSDLPGKKIITEAEIAELAKYVDNAWHGLKVAFGNEVGVIAKSLGIDSHEVIEIFFEDRRLNISTAYLKPGFAFGGSCLPKDLRALNYLGRQLDLILPILDHVLDSNQMVIDRGLEWILSQKKKRIAFLGISFKSGTDDVRESPFVNLIERLIGKGCEVRIFDPNVRLAHLMGANREFLMDSLPHIANLMVPKIEDAVQWAEVIVVTNIDPIYVTAVLSDLENDQIVLDFARIPATGDKKPTLEGFLW
jgi:GDP-mannose 6-dehydrogenase